MLIRVDTLDLLVTIAHAFVIIGLRILHYHIAAFLLVLRVEQVTHRRLHFLLEVKDLDDVCFLAIALLALVLLLGLHLLVAKEVVLSITLTRCIIARIVPLFLMPTR